MYRNIYFIMLEFKVENIITNRMISEIKVKANGLVGLKKNSIKKSYLFCLNVKM